MVVSPAGIPVSTKFGRLVAAVTRLVAVVAVVTQAALLGIEVSWAVRDHTPIGDAAGRQGSLFAATALLTAVVFWLAAQNQDHPRRNRRLTSHG